MKIKQELELLALKIGECVSIAMVLFFIMNAVFTGLTFEHFAIIAMFFSMSRMNRGWWKDKLYEKERFIPIRLDSSEWYVYDKKLKMAITERFSTWHLAHKHAYSYNKCPDDVEKILEEQFTNKMAAAGWIRPSTN